MINPRAFCVLALLLVLPFSIFSQPSNGITREVYANIGGSALSDLTNNPAFPNSPTTEDVLTNSIDCPVNYLDNYGTRLRALVIPPASGSYTFWIASDDQSALYLSTDANPANKQLIARVNTWTSWKEWTKETNQQSAPISLVAGQQYYLEALQKEGQGGDSLTVRWQLPAGAIEEPIPASRFIPVGVSAPVFNWHPTNSTVVEGNQASFTVRITRSFGATLQWQRNNTNIPSANGTNILVGPVTLGDSGSTFRCIAVNPYGSTTSFVATLTVVADTTPPAISSVGNLGDNDVITVVFSEPVETASAINPANYGINNNVNIVSASMGVDSRTVVLTTTPMQVNVTYTLTVNNVRDRAATPNTIAANTQRTFSISPRPLDMFFVKPQPEPIGPSTRRGPFVISEVMYHPTNRLDGRNLEFVEVYNSSAWPEEMGGFRISGAVEYTFPSNFVLGARSFAVVAAVPADMQAVYGIGNVLGPWTGGLQNSAGSLRILNAVGAVMFEMEYAGEAPYPVSADGAGHSLVLARPTFGERDVRAWAASEMIGGTPGANQVVTANPLRMIFINEFLAHTDLPDIDFIEIYNYSSTPVNIGGCVLTDNADTNKFIIPTNTMIPANGFITFYETNLGFALSAEGEAIFLKNPQNTRVLDAIRFEPQENGVSMGRFPDGAPQFYRLNSQTPGASNVRQRAPNVVINELMYHPLTEDDADEYIELRNTTTNAVNVGKWRIKDAVKFTIPDNAIISPGGYLVIAANAARMRSVYPGLNLNNCVGDWEGSLRNSGERVALTMPDQVISTNILGQSVTNTIHIVVDEVSYRDGGRWGSLTDGNGSSLELRDWRNDRRMAPSWADSDETIKSGWTNVEVTGVMDNGWENATQLHVTLMGAGEVLIDNVEVINPNFGTNLIGNPSFENGTGGWVFQGNHNATGWNTNEGFGSARSLHLRASGRGDPGANRVRTQLPFTLTSGSTITMRAKVRWLKGNPNILLRLRGNYLEAPGFTLTARNLGTPGAANSSAVTNSAPVITDVAHWPPLPANNQQVLVTARASDADGLATLLLRYRIDPNTNYVSLSMTNNGGGLFSAVLPAQVNAAVAFYIQAADRLQPSLGSTFPNDAPSRECVVRWGDTNVIGTLGTYRFWLTQRTIDQWSNEEKMSNKGKDVTFIHGTNRVVYNANAWFHGSPYHSPAYNTPVGNSCDYDMNFPTDDRFLGETDINLFRPGNGGGDGTIQAEIHAYWFGNQFGVPFLYHRPVFLFVNGLRRDNLYYDAQQPNGDFVEQWFPEDADGELHKIQLGFEFGDTAYGNGEAGYAAIGANFGRYTTTGGAFKLARYRATLPWRSASPYQQNNYTSIYNLVNATLTTAPLNTPAYTTVLTNMFDVREWYKVHVTQHLYNNTDSFSYGGGQNAFMYKPTRDGWKLFLWDVDFAFGGNASDANLTGIGGADHGPRNDHAPFTRIYWQALIEAANGMMTPARSDTILDARYNGLIAAGASVSSPVNIKNFIVQKRAVILGMLSTNNTAPFEILSNGGADYSVSNNLVTLTGRAPFEVAAIEINGVLYDVTWTSRTNWSLQLALPSGSNVLNVVTYDSNGRALTNLTDSIRVNVTAPPAPPQDFIAINEIMFAPTIPDAEYVELFNTSTNVSFDLSNWRFEGLSYGFPESTIMPPRTFLVLAKDRAAFAAAYGTNIVPFDVFSGNLQANGETLTLIKPGATAAQDIVVDKVRYEGALPWPFGVPPTTAAVQLIDAKQENARVGNWYGLSPLSTNSPWRFVSVTGLCNTVTPQLLMYLSETGSLHIDDISLVVGTIPALGQNLVRNGDFEAPFYEDPAVTNSWVAGTNYTNSIISSEAAHSGSSSLKMVCTSFGNTVVPVPRLIYQSISPYPTNGTICTLSYWYLPTTNATTVNIRIRNNSPLNTIVNVRPQAFNGPPLLTPGTNNSVAATIAAFPNLWINEIQSENIAGIFDAFGEREPWIELYNAGTNAVPLDGLYLSSNYLNLAQWAFPTGVVIQPGEFKLIIADGEPNETTNGEVHAGFRLSPGTGSVALSRPYGQDIQVLDYMNYVSAPGHSYGSFPDGQPFTRFEMYFVTAGNTNNGTLPPLNIYINEWLADNVGALADPADGNYEDWFEIYNPGDTAVSLGGYFLTDVLTDKFKYQIPQGYSIPAQGYLLVWADGEPAQNNPASPELHTSFSLSRGGEAIGLFTPEGLQVDAVTFGAQDSDIAQGRFPDGSTVIYSLTNYTPSAPNYYPLPNVPPKITGIANRSVFEGFLLNFPIVATDGNLPGQQLTWWLLGAPAGAGIGASDGVFSWIPSEAQGGSNHIITVKVSDNGVPSLSDTQTFTVAVLKTNNVPNVSVPGDGQVNEGAVFSFTALASDADVPAQSLEFSLDSNGLPAGAVINATNGLFTWQPGEEHGGNAYVVTVRVADNGTPPLTNTAAIIIRVNESNAPPALVTITNRSALLGETVAFTISATDSDLPIQLLTFDFASTVPAGATINSTNGQFSWVANNVGTNTFLVRVTDDGAPAMSDTETFEVVVTASLQITTIAVSNDAVSLIWNATPGSSYGVEYKNSLSDPDWALLVTNILATTNTVGIIDPVGTNTQRIYRIVSP